MINRISFCIASIILVVLVSNTAITAATNQTLEGQLAGLANDVNEFLSGDRLLKGRKVRLDRVSSSGLPDANYDQYLEQELSKFLKDVLDDGSTLLLKVEYSYLISETQTNKDNRVIQISAKLMERGRTAKSFLREVNNTSDISRVLGNTLTPPDTTDYKERLTTTETAFEQPKFALVGKTQVIAAGNPKYSVEIRKRAGGKGQATAVVPTDDHGRAYAPLSIADTYEIVVFNYDTEADAVVKLDIDGLDVINTFNADQDAQGHKVKHEGYFIPRATSAGPGVHVIPGWFHTLKHGSDNVYEFVVNELGKGAASKLMVRGKTGVITARFFDAYKPSEKPRGRNFGETGKGQPRKQDYAVVDSIIGSEPVSQVTIRYSHSPDEVR